MSKPTKKVTKKGAKQATKKVTKKLTVKSLQEEVQSLTEVVQDLRLACTVNEQSMSGLNREINKQSVRLTTYINRQFTQIRVLPKGHNPKLHGGDSRVKFENGWEDYSGDFYVTDEDNRAMIIGKAKAHFSEYFEKGVHHRNKRLGLFLSGGEMSGKKLIEEIKTGD